MNFLRSKNSWYRKQIIMKSVSAGGSVGVSAITQKLRCVCKCLQNNSWGAGVRALHRKIHHNPTSDHNIAKKDVFWKWNQTKFNTVRPVCLSAVLWIRVGSYFGRHLSSNPNKTERWMRVLVLQQKFLSNIRGGLNFDYRQPKIRPLKA